MKPVGRSLVIFFASCWLALSGHAAAQAANIRPPADVAAAPLTAQRTPSGLAFKVLKLGTGSRNPGPRDTVTVHYSGWTTDGKLFDSSWQRNQPGTLAISQVIAGWAEGLQLMVQGEQRRFWIPARLAYGDTPAPGLPKGMLVFDVELLAFSAASAQPFSGGLVKATIETSKGIIELELDADQAPLSVQNFSNYAKRGHYAGTIFHRCLPGFGIQGGGYSAGMNLKPTDKPIPCESKNGLKNIRGAVSMARTAAPHSATSQFFINVKDNSSMDYPGTDGWGFAVFGRVARGIEICDAIASAKTRGKGEYPDLPVTGIVIKKVTITEPSPAISTILSDDKQPRIEVIKDQGPNAMAWALAPLNEVIPTDIRENLTFLREDLLDEGAKAAKAPPHGLPVGLRLL